MMHVRNMKINRSITTNNKGKSHRTFYTIDCYKDVENYRRHDSSTMEASFYTDGNYFDIEIVDRDNDGNVAGWMSHNLNKEEAEHLFNDIKKFLGK